MIDNLSMQASSTEEQIIFTHRRVYVGLTNISAACHLLPTAKGKHANCPYFYSDAFKNGHPDYENTTCLRNAGKSLKSKQLESKI